MIANTRLSFWLCLPGDGEEDDSTPAPVDEPTLPPMDDATPAPTISGERSLTGG